MNRKALVEQILRKRSFLCVGLDTDIERIPEKFRNYANPVLAFNEAIVEITSPYCVAYKPNTAFYECHGWQGWKTLEDTLRFIPESHLTIVDAKRGDIGNTSLKYAKAFFEQMNADALTVAPYMGSDSVQPFLEYKDKWLILLAVTSNEGSNDFQLQQMDNGDMLFEKVVKTAQKWGSPENLMFVVGATRSGQLARMREIAPENFFLVPGVGAQGGSLEDVAAQAMTNECGLLVNASRSIIYAGNSANFEQEVENACLELQQQMEQLLIARGLVEA
jgi:orotidine-5'-phosphate decarboxylase